MTSGTPPAWRLVIDVAPLREERFTGIPNVVKEVARRALLLPPSDLAIDFAVGDQLIDPKIVDATVSASNGRLLENALLTGVGVSPLPMANPQHTAGLNLHIKAPVRRFAIEALFCHDLSYLSVPKVHQAETVRAHLKDFPAQIETTDIFFTNSAATSLDLQWYCGVAPDRIHVTHLGHDIDPVTAAAMAKRLGPDVEPFLIVLGTIEPRKNIGFLLDWLAANPSVLDEYRIVFCGPDGWGDSFDTLVERAGLIDAQERRRITRVGFASAAQRLALLVSAEALLFPSRYEGFGLPALEAMACGTNVIASCSTSIPEVVGPDGFYFDPLDSSSLDAAFQRFNRERGSVNFKQRSGRLVRRSSAFSYDTMFAAIIATIRSRLETTQI